MTPLVLLLALAAPAPKAKPPKPLHIVPGEYVLAWAGSPLPMIIRDDGSYSWGDSWHGSWSYDHDARLLFVRERCGPGGDWHQWYVSMKQEGSTLKGTADFYRENSGDLPGLVGRIQIEIARKADKER